MKAKLNTIYGWRIRFVSFMVVSTLLLIMDSAHADRLRTNVPTKLSPPLAELVPVKPKEVVTPPIMPVVVPVVELKQEPEVQKCAEMAVQTRSIEPGKTFFSPGLQVDTCWGTVSRPANYYQRADEIYTRGEVKTICPIN